MVEHNAASVTVTVYELAARLEIFAWVLPLDHTYEKSGVPPDTERKMLPLDCPLQVTWFIISLICISGEVFIEVEPVFKHPFASDTVTV